ncbi:hypothetical protein VHEMI07760 [[Torrubiella] hemipterigena]|uniref:Mid2 domain-containing protein n=1 Tax=[Torrubiella] hemipterigena TaxID=1531966 RepID=A0A0A1TM88_9HYPO|nr:hypothetical protein VHEMI07760 [[Torrubiella] hemipterigena]
MVVLPVFLLAAACLAHATQTINSRLCYFPNGEQAVNDTACTSDSVSVCCQDGSTCLGNGLCFNALASAVGGFIRGSCTDKSRKSSGCPQYCTYDNKTAGLWNSLSDAGVLNCGNGGYCCESDPIESCNCQNRNGVFSLSGDLKPIKTIASDALTPLPSSPASHASSPPSTSSTGSASSTATPSGSSSSIATASKSVPSSSSTHVAIPTSDIPAPNTNTNDSTKYIALGVGLGLGIPLVAGVIGLAAFMLGRGRQKAKEQKDNGYYRPPSPRMSAPAPPYEYKAPAPPAELTPTTTMLALCMRPQVKLIFIHALLD